MQVALLLGLLAAAGLAQAQIALTIDLTGPATVTPGNQSVYGLVVGNTGATSDDPNLDTNFPTAGTTIAWTCVAAGAGTTCGNASGSGNLNHSNDDIAQNGTVTYQFTVTFPSSYGNAPFIVTASADPSPAGQTGTVTDTLSVTVQRESDLSISKTSAAAQYAPGGTGRYTVVVTNDGPSDASGVGVNDTAPAQTTFGNWTCVRSSGNCGTASGSGNLAQTISLPAGLTQTYTLNVNYNAGATAASIVNTASLTVPAAAGDPDNTDHSDDATVTRNPLADFTLAFTPSSGLSYIPGTNNNIVSLRVTNGSAVSAGSQLTLDFPAAAVSSSVWSCVPAAACSAPTGNGDLVTNVTLAAGAFVDIGFVVSYSSGALLNPMLFEAVLEVDGAIGADPIPDPADRRATNSYTIDRRADVGIDKIGPAASAPGGPFRYDLVVTNYGPSDVGNGPGADDILLTDDFVAELRRGNIVPVPAACSNPALPCWRYCPSDNGVVGNYTPAMCPVTVVVGSGDILDLPLQLRSGSSSTLEAYVSTDQAVRGTLTNNASVAIATSTPAITETNGGNNSDGTSTLIQPSTDIEVTKTDNLITAIAGSVSTYTVVVTNQGFESANGVRVQDTLPLYSMAQAAGFVPGSISWQCRAFNNGCCSTDGGANSCGLTAATPPVTANAIDTLINLPNDPARARVEFTITGTIDPRASGTLSNTASATLPAGLADTDPSNNSATDDTTLASDAQLSISKRLVSISTNPAPPYTLTYEVIIGNDGPSRVDNADVDDPLGDTNLDSAGANWTCATLINPGSTQCDQPGGAGPLVATVDLDAGGSIRFEVVVPTTPIATGQITNTATIAAGANVLSSTVVTSLAGSGDLSVEKRESSSSLTAIPGTEIEYVITVKNTGPDDAFGAQLTDLLPPGLENVSWSCAATTPVPGDLAYMARAGGTTGARGLVASSEGRHLYSISEGGRALSVYDRVNVPGLNFGNVALLETEVNGVNDAQDVGGVVSGMHVPRDIAMAPNGAMVFVLSAPDAAAMPPLPAMIAGFNRVTNALDPAYGKLSFAGSATIPAMDFQPARIAVTNGNIYVTGVSQGTSLISIYRRAAATGLPLFDIDFAANVPTDPGPMAVSLSDAALFVASASAAGSARVARFQIDPANGPIPPGRLSHVASEDDAGLNGITDLAIAPAQQHLYALAAGNESVARLNYGTGLALATNQTAADLGVGGTQPFLGTVHMALAPDGEHLLLTNRGNAPSSISLVQLRRDPISGGLSYEAGLFGAGATGIDGASDIVVTPDGRHVIVSSSLSGVGPPIATQLTIYTRRAPDPLFGFIELDRNIDGVPGNPLPGMQAPADIVTSPDGQHVYSISLAEGAIAVFRRDPRSGAESNGGHLTHVVSYINGQGGISGIARASRVLISPNGASLYVSSEDNNTVTAFTRDTNPMSATYGRLTQGPTVRDGVGGVDGLLGAQGMAMDRGSSHLYVAGSFEAAVATFRREANGSLTYLGVIKAGSGGAVGMSGMRDLVVSGDGEHVMGVSSLSNAVVVFKRETSINPPANPPGNYFGKLSFRQARTVTGVRLMALAIPSTAIDQFDNEHIYVVGQDDSSLIVMRRVTDTGSSAYGTVSTLFEYRGLAGLNGPRDVAVSPDGRRVYVGAQFSNSVLVLDRDLNQSSQSFGSLAELEVRTDSADGVDGLANLYAISVSSDSRNVYVAGFGDRAVASFAIGSGSSCSAAGGGDVDDLVNIGANGTLEYRVRAQIAANATGVLTNEACVVPPARFIDPDASNDCSSWDSDLTPQGDLAIFKTNGQVSAGAGEFIRYQVQVTNPGPSNLVHSAMNPLTVTDLLDSNPGLVPGSATWTCSASGSGALDFVEATFDGATGVPPERLAGVADLARVEDPDGMGPLPGMLVAASVLDDSVTLFERDLGDGTLTPRVTVFQGGTLLGTPIDSLAGARTVLASADGLFIYVGSRISDAISVFAVEDAGGGVPQLRLIEVQRNRPGLDQVTHLASSPDGRFIYAAGANDDAIAVYARDDLSGALTWVESEINGVDDLTDPGAVVAGLDGVEYLVPSPDGEHLYALSGSGGSVARFDRDNISGRLSWHSVRDGMDFGIGLDGASAAVFDVDGEYLYVSAGAVDRIVVLQRNNQASSGTFGDLSLASSVTEGVGDSLGLLAPRRVLLSDDGAHLYVAAQSGSSIAWYARDPADGSLRYLGLRSEDSAGVDGLRGATGLAFDPVLGQLYVAGTLANAIAQFDRQADSVCPASGSGDLNAIPVSIAAGGSVTFLIDVQVSPTLVGSLTNVARVDSNADPDTSNNVSTDTDQPSLQADLQITKDDGQAAYDGLLGARAIVGSARHLYVAGSDDNAIGLYGRNDDLLSPDYGAMRFLRTTRTGVNGVLGLNAVADIALSADGAHLYAVSPSENSIAAFARDPVTGTLSFLEIERNGVLGVAGMSGARAVALSPDGRHVYVASGFANSVVFFARQHDPAMPDYGRLTYMGLLQHGVGGVDGMIAPIALQVSPDGQHVYALSATGISIAVLRRNPNPGSGGFGQLTFLRRYQGNAGGGSGLEGGRSLAMDASGAHLYVLGTAPGSLAHFLRTPASGELVLDDIVRQGVDGASGLLGAERLQLSPDGAQLYVAAGSNNAVAFYRLGVDGRLTFGSRISNGDAAGAGVQVLGLAGVRDVFVAPDGAHLYSVAAGDAAISAFDRLDAGAQAGELSYRQTLFDGLGGVAPGSSVRYTIVVSNAGPASVPQATVVDVFPPQFVSASWNCVAQTGGAQCAPTGNGNINTIVNLPAGSSLTIEAVGVLGDSVNGTLVNTATVTANSGTDPNPGNNSATDGDTVLSPALDLRSRITAVLGNSLPGGRIDYAVEISNLGPTYATAATVTDQLPDAVLDADWSCRAFPVAGTLGLAQNLTQFDGSTSAAITALATAVDGRHVYATATLDGISAVLSFRRDPLNGTLQPIAALRNGVGGVGGIDGAVDIMLSGDERFVYVAGSIADAIAVFSRNADTGELTFLTRYIDGEFGIDGLGGVRRLLLGPGGSRLYAAGELDDAIAIFSINPGSGLLSQSGLLQQSQPGVDGLNGVSDLAWSANAAHLLVVARQNQSIAAFARNPGNGALTPAALLQEFELGDGALTDPSNIEVRGGRIFVASNSNGRVTSFRFDPAPVVVPPAVSVPTLSADDIFIAGLLDPADLRFESDQARLYVAVRGSSRIELYNLLTDQPERLAQYPAVGVQALALAPNATQLYAGGSGLGTWSRERGSRCPAEGLGTIGAQLVDIAPGGRLEYFVGGTLFPNAVGQIRYQVEAQPRELSSERQPSDNIAFDERALLPSPTLSATKTDSQTEVVAGEGLTYQIGLFNSGVSAAVGAHVIDQPPIHPAINAGLLAGSGTWSCAVDPPLQLDQIIESTGEPMALGLGRMAISPDGSRLYAVNATRNALLVFERLPDNSLGAVTEIAEGSMLGTATVTGLTGASSVAVSADGSAVLVTGATANSLVVLGYNAVTGMHSYVQTLTSGSGGVLGLISPQDVIFASNDSRVFVASPGSDSIAVFTRNAATGGLQFVERVRDGFGTIVPDSNVIQGVRRLRASDDGRNLYAVSYGSQSLATFSIDPVTASLTYRGVLRHGVEPGLAGARDLVSTQGDKHLYALGDGAIVRFGRQPDGSLVAEETVTGVPGLVQPRSLVLDRSGARLYLVDAQGSVSVFRRDWSSGELALRDRLVQTGTVPDANAHAIYVDDGADLMVSVASPGTLWRYDERPMSWCITSGAATTGIDTTLDLGVGGRAQYSFSAIVHPSARGVLSNIVRIEPRAGSASTAVAGEAQDDSTIIVVSDLSVQKTGPVQAVAGTPIDYEIRVQNAGPSDALGMRVVEVLPAALSGVTWTCSATGTSSCPASGSTTLDMMATLKVGDELVIALRADIDSAYLGTLTNRVELVPEVGATDPVPGNDFATADTEVVAEVDVSISKSDGVDTVIAGTTTVYAIDVINAGPSDAHAVQINDPLPPGIRSTTWTCVGSGGATCTPAGIDSVQISASIPAGESLSIQVTALVADNARGQIQNLVEAVVLAPTTELEPDDNTASDINIIDVSTDLGITLVDPLDPFDPAGPIPMPYQIDVFNAGPSSANALVITLDMSHTVALPPPAGCSQLQRRLTCNVGALAAGAHQVYNLAISLLPAAPAQFDTQGQVTAAEADPVAGNNLALQSTLMRTGTDLDVSITRDVNLVLGEPVSYVIRVRNIGSQPANGFSFDATVAPELLNPLWTCSAPVGGSCSANASGNISDPISLGVGQTLTYTLSATVDPMLDTSAPIFIEQTVAAVGITGVDINPANNIATERGEVKFGIFRDGFEDPVIPRPRSAGGAE